MIGVRPFLEIVGCVLAVGGVIYWYSTPDDVVLGPLAVVFLGLAIAGVGIWMRRGEEKAGVDELKSRIAQEREGEE